jgi:DNA end-binding protein Ku
MDATKEATFMASTAWRGAIELAGLPVNIRLYSRTKSRSSESFKTLAPNGLPISQQMVDTTGKVVTRDETSKAVPTGPDTFIPLTDAQLALIQEGGKSTLVQPKQFAPRETVPLELSLATFDVLPNDNAVDGKSTSIVWNGLRDSGWVYATDIVMRGGSRDAILVLWADDEGLYASTLPYAAELHDNPTYPWTKDAAQAQAFAQFVQANHQDVLNAEFNHDAHTSEYRARRQQAIDAALEGKEVVAPKKAKAEAAVPDLMAVLAQASGGRGGRSKKAPAKTTTRKKVSK